ncbi:MAG: hypothetical protein F4X47_05585 [Gammaproteobacteria bacterium]|nr:hypothetical protein [Gammaproteobacteria bacterium]MYC51772.1 hypothetical protein [Gammaproteobacteria bacterium]
MRFTALASIVLAACFIPSPSQEAETAPAAQPSDNCDVLRSVFMLASLKSGQSLTRSEVWNASPLYAGVENSDDPEFLQEAIDQIDERLADLTRSEDLLISVNDAYTESCPEEAKLVHEIMREVVVDTSAPSR